MVLASQPNIQMLKLMKREIAIVQAVSGLSFLILIKKTILIPSAKLQNVAILF